MPVLTSLSQFEQYDLETEICDAGLITRSSAGKILAEVLVPELDKRIRTGVARAVESAIADLYRMDRINKTPLEDVKPRDLAWSRAGAQRHLRALLSLSTPRDDRTAAAADWLRDRALRGAS